MLLELLFSPLNMIQTQKYQEKHHEALTQMMVMLVMSREEEIAELSSLL
jgi:hypothetical protein